MPLSQKWRDELCESLGRLFIDLLEQFKRGEGGQILARLNALKSAGQLLGLFSRSPGEFQAELFELKNRALGLDTKKIEALIEERNAARRGKDWTTADRCRDKLAKMGVVIEDTAGGTEWKIK